VLLLVPGVFAAVARVCLQLVQGEHAQRGSGAATRWVLLQRRGGAARGAARGARLAVRLAAIGMDPHLIEEWTRNQ